MKHIKVILVFLLVILSGCTLTQRLSDKIINKIDEKCIGENTCQITLNEITYFKWDKCVIFDHQCSPAEVSAALGIEYKGVIDLTTGIVFVRDNKIVYEEHTPILVSDPVKFRYIVEKTLDRPLYVTYTYDNAVLEGTKTNIDGKYYYTLKAVSRLPNQPEQPSEQSSTEDVSVMDTYDDDKYDDVKADYYYTLEVVQSYLDLKPAAVSENEFNYIKNRFFENSEIYEREKKDIEDAYSKGIKQNLIMSYYIDIKELPDNKYYVYYIGEIEETDAANVVSEKTIAYVFTVFDDMEVQKILDISATIITPSDYSSFAGEWFCLERSTSLELEIDRFGYVKGNILPIAGQHVPCSPVSGFIEGNILTSRLYDGEYHEQDVGSLVLYFDNPEILKGTVTLIKPGLELAEGDMVFERYNPK